MKVGFGAVIVCVMVLISVCAFAAEKPLLAIMPIQDEQKVFTPEIDEAATSYLRRRLEVSGAFIVVDKSRQEETLIQSLKKESYDVCADERCQIDLGRALSADTLLKSAITKLGDLCTFTATLVDLEREAAIGGGESYFGCTENGLRTALDTVIADLIEEAGRKPAVRTPTVRRPAPKPSTVRPVRRTRDRRLTDPTVIRLAPSSAFSDSQDSSYVPRPARKPMYTLSDAEFQKMQADLGIRLTTDFKMWKSSGQHTDFLRYSYERQISGQATGMVFTITGALMSMGFVAYGITYNQDLSDGKRIAMLTFGSLGGAFMIVGIPIWAVYDHRKKKLKRYILRQPEPEKLGLRVAPTVDGQGGMILLGGRF